MRIENSLERRSLRTSDSTGEYAAGCTVSWLSEAEFIWSITPISLERRSRLAESTNSDCLTAPASTISFISTPAFLYE